MTEKPIIFSGPFVRAILDGKKTMTRRLVNMKRLRVSLPQRVMSEPPIMMAGLGKVANAAVYNAHLNPQGAVSVVCHDGGFLGVRPGEFNLKCPYGSGRTILARNSEVGRSGVWEIFPSFARLWVREAWAVQHAYDGEPPRVIPSEQAHRHYAATEKRGGLMWRSPLHMPRWASRVSLEVVSIRLEQLQHISNEDAIAEGVDAVPVADVPRQSTFSQRDDFAQLWNLMHRKPGTTWADKPWVWAVSFRRSEEVTKCLA